MKMEISGAWFLLFALHPSGTTGFPAPNSPRQVNGILGGSALLSIVITPPQPVADVEWKFQGKTGNLALLIAEFGDGKPERPNPQDRFGQRLELANETALRIKALELEDSGVFSARVRLASATVREHLFHLAVYAPLPAPQIVPQLVLRTPNGCNVTLQCLAFESGDVTVFWKRGSSFGALEGASDKHQLSDDGRTLRFFWESSSPESSFTCLVSSPVEERRVSFDLLGICSKEEGNPCFSWPRVVIVIGLVGQIAIVVIVHTLDGKDRKLS